MKKILTVVCVVAMILSMSIVAGAEETNVITITTAEELVGMADNLTADYVLDADIDLAGIAWTPIGTYKPSGESAEEQEIPASDAAFTGTFDGQGHTIRNLTITGQDGIAVGLFGCIANTEVGNFTLENASTEGTVMVADAVGYSYTSTVHDIHLINGKVTVYASEMSAEGMYGGIVGAGMSSRIIDCSADAEIVIPDGTANAGIVGGGLELTSLVNCTATGSVTAGANCYGLGGISGCGFGAEESLRTDPFTPQTESAAKSFASVLARAFNADYALIAHSGFGICRNYNSKYAGYYMPERYLQTFDMERGDSLHWNAKKDDFRPQMTIIFLGGNDFSVQVNPVYKTFEGQYIKLIQSIRANYGDKHPILCCTKKGVPMLQEYMRRLMGKVGQDGIYYVSCQDGIYPDDEEHLGACQHPSYEAHRKMACMLIPYVSSILGWQMPADMNLQ